MLKVHSTCAACCWLLFAATSLSAQPLTASLEGRVTDAQHGVLPQALITVLGAQGARTSTTDAAGTYRFTGLDAGSYEIRVEAPGFKARTERTVSLGTGRTLVRDFVLDVGGPSETLVVDAPVVLEGRAETRATLSSSLLFQVPINLGPFNAATTLADLAPGVNRGSAFGGDGGTSSTLMLDGVDVRDPDAGAPWVFYNYDIVQSVQVGGLGAPAAYGGFTGAVVQTLTKSGSNRRSGLVSYRHTNDGWAGRNLSAAQMALNPTLKESSVLTRLNDVTAQFGGPWRLDRLFYWTSVQRYALAVDPAGPISRQTETSPRVNGKLTWRRSAGHTLTGSLQFDRYDIAGLPGFPQTFSTDEQTLEQASPEFSGSLNYQRVLGGGTLVDVRFAGFRGRFSLTPVDESPVRLDAYTGGASGGGGYSAESRRQRGQVNAFLSRQVHAAGAHDLQVGVEWEHSGLRNQQSFSNHIYYLDFAGAPYLAFSGSEYDIEAKNRRVSVYAQDGWRMRRFTLDAGVRLDLISGRSPRQSEPVYTPVPAIGPRVGAAVDVTGRGSAVLAASYGRYYEGSAFSPYSHAVPGYADYVSYDVLAGGRLAEFDRVREFVYAVDPDIRHLGTDEATVSWQQRLLGIRIGTTAWWREFRNITGSIVPRATWSLVPFTNPLDGSLLALYRWVNRSQTDRSYLIGNLKTVSYRDPAGNQLASVEAYRRHRGVMIVGTRPLRHGVEAQFSYVWSEGRGTVGNRTRDDFGGTAFENPNLGAINADGLLEHDRTHEFKGLATVALPWNLMTSAVVRSVSGRPYTPVGFVAGASVNNVNALSVNLEPRGSRRYEAERQLDWRLEYVYRRRAHRIGILVDVQNLLNASTVLAVQTRYPFRAVGNTIVPFEAPVAVTGARQVTMGARWSF